jgi:hypothetical protein
MVAIAGGSERNRWPLAVEQTAPDGTVVAGEYLGPLFLTSQRPGQPAHEGFRPFYLQTRTADRETHSLLYPLFVWDRRGDYRSFTFFKLYNRSTEPHRTQGAVDRLDVWPFYFSRTTADPATSYQALLPFAGTIKERFGKDHLEFIGFPFYLRTVTASRRITHAPWPFVRVIDGAGHRGFELWPLFGHRARAGDYEQQFYLWPLFYKSARNLAAAQPTVSVGALPFYTRDTAPGYRNETYLWPFFGYTRRTEPYRYDENRYLWPFFVQGRGDQRVVNRWGPFYTHSTIKGQDKTWVLWPLFRHAAWTEEGVAQEKHQLFFVVYWSLTQRSLTNPAAAPAHKTHLWPLVSAWDNGAGRRQWQFLSPLEVFFPTNETIRQVYSPLFALYRYDRQDRDTVRQAWLWNAITYRRTAQDKVFNFGPVLSVAADRQQQRIAFAGGLLGLQRAPGQRVWRPFWFDFSVKKASSSPAGTPP